MHLAINHRLHVTEFEEFLSYFPPYGLIIHVVRIVVVHIRLNVWEVILFLQKFKRRIV